MAGKFTSWKPRRTSAAKPYANALVSLIFISAGAALIAIATGMIELDLLVPPQFITAVGGLLALIGLLGLFSSLVAIAKSIALIRARRKFPDRPWFSDHSWDIRGCDDEKARRAFGSFFDSLVSVAFVLAISWGAITQTTEDRAVTYLIVGIIDLITLVFFAVAVKNLLRRFKYGVARVQFKHFPFFTGENLDIVFEPPRNLDDFNSVTIELQCHKEYLDISPSANGRKMKQRIRRRRLWKTEHTVEGPGRFASLAGGLSLPIVIPENAKSTELNSSEPIYWELTIEADTPGIDFSGVFLVPIYRRLN